MELSKKKIRKIYYLSGSLILIIIVIAISVPFNFLLNIEYNKKISQLSDSILKQKHDFLTELVNEKISDIDYISTLTKDELEIFSNTAIFQIQTILDNYKKPEEIRLTINRFLQSANLSSISYNITYNGRIISNVIDPSKPTLLSKKVSYRDSGSIEIIIYAEDYNSIVKKRVIKSIRNSKLSDNGYFWINEIIDFDGGDNYAIRLVHPNLIETEGNYLSTNFKDNHGNQPYLTELNGIKSDGYVLFDYYFKKLNSSKVSHKLSYSKLYKPFNWVVATGIYLDDVDEFISNEKNIMETSLRRIRVASVFAILIAILICGIIVWFFEKVISTMIKEFNLDINKAYKKLEVIAYKDTLSGLLNRRSMAHHMDEELSRASRNNTYFGIIMLDIDHFKNINDTYGHDIGDIVIQKVSQVLKNTCRSEDKLSRWGGEEFLILAISPNIENLISMAEKIRVAISELKIPVNKEEISVSATFGLSYYNGNKNIKELIKEADDNLYIGKKSGRNRVVS